MSAVAAEFAELAEHIAGQAFSGPRGEDAGGFRVDDRSDVVVNGVLVHDHTIPDGTDMK